MADVQLLHQEQEKDEEEEEKEVESEFVEMDPTGRYGRYREILGKGASKTVYKAFDEIEGIEMAWNQVKLQKVAKTPEDLRRICSEVHLLKTLKHKNIIKFYASWIDAEARHINFVTEMFTSGSLRQYRKKHKQVDLRAIKNWARQILRGLLYLHSHDPPIIHRDLKCDNILVNGNQGEVKIGDLGLAAILRKSQSARTVIGTPEFMAPELYEEEYNELVDIYAFGMCLIEMLTFDYPYSECSSTVHIYKKVMARKKPEALYKIKDPEVRRFIEKCLASASTRLSARELLLDPFLGEHGYDHNQYPYAYCDPNQGIVADIAPIGGVGYAQKQNNESMSMMELLQLHDESSKQPPHNMDFTVKGKRGDNRSNIIQLRLRILDSEGRIRSIYFPFDVKEDTAMSVAAEMVAELDLTDQDVTKIAQIIDQEIMPLFPDWKALLFSHDHDYHDNNHNTINTNMNNEERDKHIDQDYCCRSNNKKNTRELAAAGGHQHVHGSTVSSEGSLLEFVRSHCCVDYDTSQTLVPCTKLQCAAMHGRFEEVTFQLDAAAEYSSFLAEDDDDDAPPISSGSSSDLLILVNEDYSAEEAELEPESAILAKKSILQQETIAAASASASASASSQDLSEETCWHLWDGDDDDSIISRELRVLAIKHQQELRQLQRRHARALLEIECRLLQKQRAPPTSALYHDVADTKVRSQNNVCRIHQKNFCQKMNFCRNCIAGSSSKRNLESDVGATAAGSRAIRKSRSKTQVSAKPRTSSSASHRSSPKAISIPSPARARTNCRRSTPDHYKKLTKMQSFSSDADYGLFVNSLSREVNKDGHPQRMRIGKFQ